MTLVRERVLSAAKMAINILVPLRATAALLVGTVWNIGSIFYFGGGKTGLVAYFVILAVAVFLIHLFMIGSVFQTPSKIANYSRFRITLRDLSEIWKGQ